MKKRILNVFIVAMAALIVCACAGCVKDSAEAPEATVPEFTGFTVADLNSILVIYPEYCSDELFRAGRALCNAIESKTAVCPTYRSSYVDGTAPEYTEAEYEILIGPCDGREESADASLSMRMEDYGYRLIGKKIVFFGASDSNLIRAMETFAENVVASCTSSPESTFYFYTMDYMYNAEYEIDSVVLNGAPLYEYGIVYPAESELYEKKSAERLAEVLAEKTGYRLPVVSDKSMKAEASRWISVGNSKIVDTDAGSALTDGNYIVATDNSTNIVLAAGDLSGIVGAVDSFIENVTNGGASVEINFQEALYGMKQLGKYTVMSFNILTTKPNEARINRVVNTILNADPDTVGLQEVSPYWMDVLKKRLGDTYAYVGEGRDGGHNGEYSCIFYKKALFDVIDSDTYWLSETPDKVSAHETSAYRRIMTFARLRDKASGLEFVHVNTHLDHASYEARKFQAGVLVDFAAKYMDVPVLMTGDFNCTASEDTYKIITEASLVNAALEAPTAEKKATFPGNGKVIDFVFCNAAVYPMVYEVIDEKEDGEYPSDHYPILVHYEM